MTWPGATSTMGRLQDSDAAYASSLAISRQLAEKYPDVPTYQVSLGINYFNMGNRQHDSGRMQEAEAAYKSSLAIYKLVAEKHADVPSYSSDLAESYASLAVFYCDRGRFQDALAAYQSAIDTYKALARQAPDRTPTMRTPWPPVMKKWESCSMSSVKCEIAHSLVQSDLAVRKSLAEGHSETLQFHKKFGGCLLLGGLLSYTHAAVAAKDPAGKEWCRCRP